nr:MAG TPA: tail tape measure protein [Caudoviricetes sp.]
MSSATKAYETALNAQGSAAKENSRYLESLEARTTALKASFQELSNTVLDSELVATFLDLAKGALDLANNLPPAVIQFGLLSTGLTGVLTIMQQFAKNSNLLSLVLGKTASGATAATGAIGLFKGGLAGAIPTALALSAAIVAIYVAYQKYKEYTEQASRSVEDWQADIDDANAKLDENKKKLDELNKTPWYDMSDDVYKEIESLEAENKALQEQIDKYTELKDKKAKAKQKETDTLAYGVTKGAQWFGNVTQGYGNSSYYGTDLREKTYQVDVKGKNTGKLGIGAAEIANIKISDINQQLKAVNSLAEAYKVLEKATGYTKEQLDELGWSFREWDYVVTDTAETYQTQLTENLKSYTQELEKNGEISKQDIQIYQQRLQNAEKIVDALKSEQAQGKTLTQTQLDLIAAYDNLKTATNLADMAFKTDQKTMQGLIQKYPVLQSYVTSVGGAYGLSASAVNKAVGSMIDSNGNLVASTKGMALQVYQALSAIIEMQQEASMTAQYAWQNAVKTGQSQDVKDKLEQEMNSARTQRDALIKTQQKLDAAFKKSQVSTETIGGSTGDSTVSSGGGGGGGGSSSKVQTALEKQTAEYKNQISALEKQLSLLQEKDASEEEQIEVMKKIQDKLHEQAQYYRSQGIKENDEMIVDLQISWQQYSKKIVELQQQAAEKIKEIWRKNLQSQIDSLSTRKDELENLFKGIASAADDEIDKLEKQKQAVEDKYDAQINALKETNDALNNQLELETAIDNLERAKAQKVLVYKDGKYQYIDDSDAVSEASSNLESVKRQQAQEAEQKRLEQLKDKEVADIEAQIKAWQDYRDSWTALYSDYSDTQNRLLAEQMLGTKLEGKNWKDRIGQLQEFRNEYNSLVSQIGNLQSQLDKGMDTDTTDWSQVWRDAENNKSLTQAERESIQNYAHAQKVQQMQGSGYTYDSASGTWNKHAKGTLNAPGGLTLVGEKGPELGILPKGSGVIPADITKNLWDWGKTNPLDFFKGKLMQESMQNQNISIQNLSLPEVTNGEEFVEYMRKNFWRKTIQFSTNN